MRSLLSALAWTLLVLTADIGGASAQQSGRTYKIGWLWIGRPGLAQLPMELWTGPTGAFRDTLQNHGFVIGRNLVVDVRHANGEVARLAPEAHSLVAAGVDLIVTVGTAPTMAALRATNRIPIVFVGAQDPVGKKLVASLAKPGGNVTGMAIQVAGPKIFQLFREIAPATRRVGLLNYAPNVPDEYRPIGAANSRALAAAAGLELIPLPVTAPAHLEAGFAALAGGGKAGVIVSSDSTLYLWRASVLAAASRHRLITVCDELPWAQAGCLVTYAEDPDLRLRRAAALAAKILRGASPASIPVEQPAIFRLVVNARTATALELTVPPSLLATADEVIE